MKHNLQRTIGILGVALMATQLFGAPTAGNSGVQISSSTAFEQAAAGTPAQKEVNRLLKRISSNAAMVGRHADTLGSFSRGTSLGYETHAAELTRAKDAINAMGADLRELQELRPSALPWQQTIIDRVEPMLARLAGNATEAIQRLNLDRGRLQSQEYRDAVEDLNVWAGQARNLISVNMDYAEAREKLNRFDAAAAEFPVEVSSTVEPAVEPAALPAGQIRSLEQQVRSELLKLPYYGVFDHLTFQVEDDRVTLGGFVNWPALKTDAEQAVRGIESVGAVDNTIEVLPLSSHDDRIRVDAYRAIYGDPTLARYSLNPHPPVRIIVRNGHLTLMGVVGSDMDRTIAHLRANSVPGAFSVTNNLEVGS